MENKGGIIIYEGDGGQANVKVRVEGETVWLSQAQLVELFHSSKANVSEHIKHIFEEGELERNSVVRKFRTTAADGKKYTIEHYDLDMIISLGYRVKSSIATQFRIWAIEKAEKEYRQYQVKTISPVEKAYLDTIKAVQKQVEKKTKGEK